MTKCISTWIPQSEVMLNTYVTFFFGSLEEITKWIDKGSPVDNLLRFSESF